ncbi:pilus assembly protein [Microbacterium trichothecenolyticum]|uniref:TadE/TadG family type IV pilus assembly protein n=1 Tax=Microbacterium trichothecenolyticum TaxID=69370 RepID=UPI001C6E8C1D|nr:TadE/TadG family type IV pilus assembly protein [Microbacterium trichothecenolyticum]MBW9118543.1 pilus assembly protein [Microbacterium trichothecenolyticum]
MRVVLARAAAGVRAGLAANLRDEAGASPVEFVLVGALLTVLTLSVLQFGLAVYVRNVVHDAAVEGAYHAALADTTLAEGAQRTRDIVGRTIGAEYITDVTVHETGALGQRTVEVRVQATLPLVGLLGAPRGLEVMAHAPVESFD